MSRERVLRPDRIRIDRHIVTYLVDANVLSEGTKPDPSAQVIEWLRANERELAVDPIILGEVRFGIHILSAGKRRRRLERWFEQRATTLVCLPWGAATGLRWAELLADLRRAGLAMSVKDSMIAATALVHRLTVATRNQKDFKKAGVKVVDPFE
jgi:toxin FitB